MHLPQKLKDLQKLSKIFNVGLEYFGVSSIDEIFELIARARTIFNSEDVPTKTKEDLYLEFMAMYMDFKKAKECEKN